MARWNAVRGSLPSRIFVLILMLTCGLSLAGYLAVPTALLSAHAQEASGTAGATPSTSSAATPATDAAPPPSSTSLLVGRVWKITKAPSEPPAGSIYVFLADGTLLETSCVETYRIATWTTDKRAPHTLHVAEDHRPAFTATILQVTPNLLLLRQRFVRSHQQREITLTAVTGEYVCSGRS
jgi:hypothetical protein